MTEVEKRELLEHQQKIFEAGAQRADKRTGSFSFLTWPFFIAPLIAGEEFLATTLKAEAGEEDDGKATRTGVAVQTAYDESQASDPPKTGAADETAEGSAALSHANAPQPESTTLPAQPHEDAPKASSPRSESVAAASGGGGGGGGGDGDDAESESKSDDADSGSREVHNTAGGSSVNALADSHLGGSQLPGGSTFETVQPGLLGDSFGPATIGSAPLPGSVGVLSDQMDGSFEAIVQTVLAAV